MAYFAFSCILLNTFASCTSHFHFHFHLHVGVLSQNLNTTSTNMMYFFAGYVFVHIKKTNKKKHTNYSCDLFPQKYVTDTDITVKVNLYQIHFLNQYYGVQWYLPPAFPTLATSAVVLWPPLLFPVRKFDNCNLPTSLHLTTLHCTVLHFTLLQWTALY